MKRYITFDMDGVLVDTEPYYQMRLRELFHIHNLEFSEEILKQSAGNNHKDEFKMFKAANPNFFETIEEFRAAYNKAHGDKVMNYNDLRFPYVKTVLNWLADNGYIIALASSSSEENIHQVLSDLDIKDAFTLIVSGHNFSRSKPDPEIYQYVLNHFGIEGKDMVVVEDSNYGITAAKAAGCTVIAKRDTRFNYDQSSADIIVDHLYQIMTHLDK